ncbi:hypothetical protein FOA52_009897 [Chlamydomonas sp. UWO 241]|nr:hypothetical protein FOA52_009897 [Chlamydomonas sp. UWO 241]
MGRDCAHCGRPNLTARHTYCCEGCKPKSVAKAAAAAAAAAAASSSSSNSSSSKPAGSIRICVTCSNPCPPPKLKYCSAECQPKSIAKAAAAAAASSSSSSKPASSSKTCVTCGNLCPPPKRKYCCDGCKPSSSSSSSVPASSVEPAPSGGNNNTCQICRNPSGCYNVCFRCKKSSKATGPGSWKYNDYRERFFGAGVEAHGIHADHILEAQVVLYFLNDFDPLSKMHQSVRDWLNGSANMRALSEHDNVVKGLAVRKILDVLGKMKTAKKGFDWGSFSYVHLDYLGEQIAQVQVMAGRVMNPRSGAPYAALIKMVRKLEALYVAAQMRLRG